MNLSKSLFLSLGVFIIGSSLQAQQWQYSNNNAYFNDGNVGIGTASPQSMLHVKNGVILASDGTFHNINARIDGTDIPALRFTRWIGTGSIQHNAFVGQFYNSALGQYSFGIGTGSSNSGDQNATTNSFTVTLGGHVGIGTSSPTSKFHIVDGNNYVRMGDLNGASTSVIELTDVNPVQIEGYNSDLRFLTSAIERVRITNGGNVLIGKSSQTNASYKLDVDGNMRTNKIVVNTTGADFVFEKDYNLRTLEELQKYIRQNKHLPEIPSAKEME
jgi:hypothetical protein